MLFNIASTVFKVAVLLIAATAAIGLPAASHKPGVEDLMLTIGALLAAVFFWLRLSEGAGPDRLSIWAGPLSSIRSRPRPAAPLGGLRRAA